MIKGINRQMIEITHTGSPYFEKAFLVVRSGDAPPSPGRLQQLAQKVVQQGETYAGIRRRQKRLWLRRLLWGGACMALGALITWGVLSLL